MYKESHHAGATGLSGYFRHPGNGLPIPRDRPKRRNAMPHRRRATLTLLLGALLLVPGAACAQTNMSRITAYAFTFKGLDGQDIRLADHAGKPILIVNTASLCGYTPQYAGLQQLWRRYRERGLLIVGVPSNDFGGQEPGGAAEIKATAHGEYGASFPLAEKAQVKGPAAHPFYRWAALERPGETPHWNFHKYLIGRDGSVKASFATEIEPTDPRIITAIERELPDE
jgi:glutathione peroxidase